MQEKLKEKFNEAKIKINRREKRILQSSRRTLMDAIQIGKYLEHIFNEETGVPFIIWLSENTKLHERVARNYRTLYNERAKLTRAELSSGLTISNALTIIRKNKAEAEDKVNGKGLTRKTHSYLNKFKQQSKDMVTLFDNIKEKKQDLSDNERTAIAIQVKAIQEECTELLEILTQNKNLRKAS